MADRLVRTWLNSDEADALRERLAAVEYERDLFAEIIRHPHHLLNHLLDAHGVEPSYEYMWGKDGLPARIRIPADLSRAVFGHECTVYVEERCTDCGAMNPDPTEPCQAGEATDG